MNPSDISSLGLVLDIIGCFLIWRFGLPADVDRKGEVHFISEQTDENEKKKGSRYDLTAMIGFVFLVVGFLLQIVGTQMSKYASTFPLVDSKASPVVQRSED